MTEENAPRIAVDTGARPKPSFLSESALPSAGRRWLMTFGLSIVSVYVLFFLLFFRRAGPRDADQYLVFQSLQYWNANLFGLAKQWTPVMCSGLSLAGEPQVPFMSLSMAIGYVLGPLYGVRLATAIYFICGALGAYLYSGLWFRYTGVRLLAATLFIGNGFFMCRLGYGHFDFMPFLLLPLMLWSLHRALQWRLPGRSLVSVLPVALQISVWGAVIAIAIDGSPVTIIHLLLWVALYALILSIGVRSCLPAGIVALACCIAGVLDAGYLWPMLEWQSLFSRATPDRFTSLFSFLWFALLPLRGKLLPANGKGLELSVFIGPIIALLIFRYRRELSRSMPEAMQLPLLGASLISLMLGMGSLKALHVPSWFSLFDMLRPLPGFRSIGVTGRYWGFLALPLSLLGAAALWQFASEFQAGWRLHAVFGAALVLQVGFQMDTLAAHWAHSPDYQPVDLKAYFKHGPETIDYVSVRPGQRQGQVLTPTRGVSNCYDMDDFIHTDIGMNDSLIERASLSDAPSDESIDGSLHAQFSSWSDIRIHAGCASSPGSPLCNSHSGSRIHLSLRQAYHPLWQAQGCTVSKSAQNNLILDCATNRLLSGVDLTFQDTISEAAARISPIAWKVWSSANAGIVLLMILQWRHGIKRQVQRRRLCARSVASR